MARRAARRALRLAALREVVESYDFDGIDLDFARNSPVLQPGQQWASRQHLTSFVRSVRSMLDEVGARRGRPFTLSARVPETIVGITEVSAILRPATP